VTLCKDWADEVASCSKVFLSASRALASKVLFDGTKINDHRPVFPKSDSRIHTVPFVCGKPSLEALKQAHERLSTVTLCKPAASHFQQGEEQDKPSGATVDGTQTTNNLPRDPPAASTEAKKTMVQPSMHAWSTASPCAVPVAGSGPTCDETIPIGLTPSEFSAWGELRSLCNASTTVFRGRMATLCEVHQHDEAALRACKERILNWRNLGEDGGTLLHAAAASGNFDLIAHLLSSGASPEAVDLRERPPYFLASDRKTRDAFRRARASLPTRWDWEKAGVPSALSAEDEERKKAKEREKRKRQKERRKQQKANAKAAEPEHCVADEDKKKRDASAQGKDAETCDHCKCSFTSSPFFALDKMFCSTDCVRSHRRSLLCGAAMH